MTTFLNVTIGSVSHPGGSVMAIMIVEMEVMSVTAVVMEVPQVSNYLTILCK